MAEKVTVMVLKVDLQCHSCYKKIKKILCKFPHEIREQNYDVKKNTVTISVVCCSPEKFRDKLYCKGGKVIICIEIKEPPKPPTGDKKIKVEVEGKVEVVVKPPASTCCGSCSVGQGGGQCCRGQPAPPPCDTRHCGNGYGCGCGRGCHLSVCYIEENPSACKIM